MAFVLIVFEMFAVLSLETRTSFVRVFVVVFVVVSEVRVVSVFVFVVTLFDEGSDEADENGFTLELCDTEELSEALALESVALVCEGDPLPPRNEVASSETELTFAAFETLLSEVALPVWIEPPSARAELSEVELELPVLPPLCVLLKSADAELVATPPDAVLPPVEAFVETLLVTVALLVFATFTALDVVFVTVVV
jgi:hypothetical protein